MEVETKLVMEGEDKGRFESSRSPFLHLLDCAYKTSGLFVLEALSPSKPRPTLIQYLFSGFQKYVLPSYPVGDR